MHKHHLIAFNLRIKQKRERERNHFSLKLFPSSLQWVSSLTQGMSIRSIRLAGNLIPEVWAVPNGTQRLKMTNLFCHYPWPIFFFFLAQKRPNLNRENQHFTQPANLAKAQFPSLSPVVWLFLHCKCLDSKIHCRKLKRVDYGFSAKFSMFPMFLLWYLPPSFLWFYSS